MSTNQKYGYDPFNPPIGSGAGFLLIQNMGDGGCYYSGGNYGHLGGRVGIFPDSTEYKQSAAELRQYILSLETTRRLQDLSNVEFVRNVKPGDALLYNYTTGNWELANYISGGEW